MYSMYQVVWLRDAHTMGISDIMLWEVQGAINHLATFASVAMPGRAKSVISD